MRKVAIITLNGYFNYGNRLQNYALQQVLKSFGFHVETILVNHNTENKNSDTKLIKKPFNTKKKCKKIHMHKMNGLSLQELIRKIAKRILLKIEKKKMDQYCRERIKLFKQFTRNYIAETDYYINDHNISKELSNRYDYFVTGSDQVWNPYYINDSSIYFLTFAPMNKRIAYAPSFGVSEIPEQYIERYKTWLSEMSILSVREEDGAKIIKDLTGRDATVLIDPTLLLTKEAWLLISKESYHKPKGEYLLLYFLGNPAQGIVNKIKEIARKNKLSIINLADILDSKGYHSGPSEFIDYINSASAFFTDSFHGSLFSILLGKPFVVFDRAGELHSLNSRIDTLLSTFQLQERRWSNIKEDNIFDIDYSHIAPIMEFERNKAFHYLCDALGVKEE